MIQITLTRQKTSGQAVIGTMTFPLLNQKEPITVPSLENDAYLIPEGTYKVERTWSPKFKKHLPLVCDVPDREGIRIHKGTIPEHSEGCILTDMAGMAYLDVLFNRIDKFCDDEEKVFINVIDPA